MAQLIKKDETVYHAEDSGAASTDFTEYPFKTVGISLGLSKTKGRYPANGFDVDTSVEQLWYVVSGSAQVQVKDDRYELLPGDMLHIDKGEPFVIDGNITLLVASSPAWTEDQHQHLALSD